ncbi:MAG: hypothetical protein ACLFMM_01475 [Methanohalobium sp.]|uniref:hypothetical protein n=1 Tax=Methanohalobium sp. TaxID=2837493 RepID=UPI0039792A9D
MKSNIESSTRPTLADRFISYLLEPANRARIFKWAWLTSMAMMVLGFMIIVYLILS